MDAILEAALKLPEEERLRLAERLLASVEPPPEYPELTPEQAAELNRRLDKLDRDGSQGLPWRDAMAVIRARHLA